MVFECPGIYIYIVICFCSLHRGPGHALITRHDFAVTYVTLVQDIAFLVASPFGGIIWCSTRSTLDMFQLKASQRRLAVRMVKLSGGTMVAMVNGGKRLIIGFANAATP